MPQSKSAKTTKSKAPVEAASKLDELLEQTKGFFAETISLAASTWNDVQAGRIVDVEAEMERIKKIEVDKLMGISRGLLAFFQTTRSTPEEAASTGKGSTLEKLLRVAKDLDEAAQKDVLQFAVLLRHRDRK